MGSRRRSSTAGTSYSTLSEQSPPPVYHPPPRAQQSNPRIHIVTQNSGTGKGRRGTSGGAKGGARSSASLKPPRDPNAPKRPTNPFLRFCDRERDNVRALHGGDANFDLTKAMGVAWHELDDDQKRPYKDSFNEDQKKYKQDRAVYDAMKRRDGGGGTVDAVSSVTSVSHHHLGHHIQQTTSRINGSNYDDDVESDDGDIANVMGRESPDAMDQGETGSHVTIGTPGGGDSLGPNGASGFTAVNRGG